VVVKLIALLTDVLLAFGVYKLVGHFKPQGDTKRFAAVAVLLLPTAVINSAAWGQCDNMLAALAVFALYFVLTKRLNLAWMLVGLSFAFKMQGIFLAPFLMMVSINRRQNFISGPVLAVLACAAVSVTPLLLGKTPADIVEVFVAGAGDMWGKKLLSWWTPNLWQWFSNNSYDILRVVGIGVGLISALLMASVGFAKRQFNDKTLLLLAALCLLLVPFLLPQMHERYYFQAEIMLLVAAFIVQKAIYLAIAMQAVTFMALVILFSDQDATYWLFKPLSLVVLAVIIVLVQMVRQTKNPTASSG
jgi:Gpi18-like mannosyltransferase